MAIIEALRKVIKRERSPLEVMLTCVRWYVAYPLSLRHIEEMMTEQVWLGDRRRIDVEVGACYRPARSCAFRTLPAEQLWLGVHLAPPRP